MYVYKLSRKVLPVSNRSSQSSLLSDLCIAVKNSVQVLGLNDDSFILMSVRVMAGVRMILNTRLVSGGVVCEVGFGTDFVDVEVAAAVASAVIIAISASDTVVWSKN